MKIFEGRIDAGELSELVLRAQQHDTSAYEAIVDLFSSRLYGFMYRCTGSRHDAEDLLQELFVRVVRTIGDYCEDGRFEAWLFRIATNLVRDRGRQRSRSRVTGSIDDVETNTTGVRSGFKEASNSQRHADFEALSRDEDIDRMQEAVATLPPAEREVVMLRYFGEFSFAEIAELMETPLGTALARAHRGLAKLRERMESAS